MTTDPLAAAIDHIRSITPADNPWTADDVSSFSPWEPDETDYAIATILNAVVSGQLINRASRDEMLAQVRRDEGFATAGAEARWIADSEAGVYDTDAPDPIADARAMIETLTGHTPGPWSAISGGNDKCHIGSGGWIADPCDPDGGYFGDWHIGLTTGCYLAAEADARLIAASPDMRDMIATLADALEAERAKVAAARLAGWRAGRDAAARSCFLSGQDLAEGDWGPEGRDMVVMLEARILALPEPKETSHE